MILENLPKNNEYKYYSKILSEISLEEKNLIIAQRCFSALGNFSKMKYHIFNIIYINYLYIIYNIIIIFKKFIYKIKKNNSLENNNNNKSQNNILQNNENIIIKKR